MKFSIGIVFVFVLGCTPVVMAGEAYSGNELLSDCEETLKPKEEFNEFGAGSCMGFVRGVDAMADTPGLPLSYKSCLPTSGVTNGQKVRVIVKYLKEHPERLHMSSAILILEALHQAFPCKE